MAGGAGSTMRMGVGTIAIVAIGVVAAIFLKGGGGSGTGGPEPEPARPTSMPNQTMAPSQPTRPLKVTIRESSYVVNGRRSTSSR
jgi:hypothetical protein